MGIQLRITLPDQPGALARVTQAIARAGADVISITVLESEAGRAVDDLRLRWPDGRPTQALLDAAHGCAGVAVLGCRRTRWVLDGRPELDLFSCLLAVPERGMETLLDMVPIALDTDWAELRAPVRRLPVLYATTTQPRDDVAPDTMPVRALATQSGESSCAYLPLQALRSVLVLGRDGGPPFLRAELASAERIVDLAVKLLERILQDSNMFAEPSELTAHLMMAEGA
jgi:hypothetical protein